MAGLPCRTSTQAQGVCSRGSSPVPFFGPCTPAPHWPRPCGPVALPSASRGGPALNLWGLGLHQLSTVRNLIFFPGAWQCRRTLVRVAESYIVETVEKVLTVSGGDTDCDQAVIRVLQKQNTQFLFLPSERSFAASYQHFKISRSLEAKRFFLSLTQTLSGCRI